MNYLKKFLCFSLLCLFGVGQQVQANVKDGFYVGIGVGGSFTEFDFRLENLEGDVLYIRDRRTDGQVIGTAFLGYGFTTCESFFIGVEVGTYFPERRLRFDRDAVELLDPGFEFEHRFTASDYVAGDILLGFRPDDCFLVYLRAGAAWTEVKFRQEENLLAGRPLFERTRNSVGGRIGVGINYALTCNWGVGLDYIYTQYRNSRDDWDDFTVRFHVRPHSHYVGLSAIYSF